MALLLVLLFKAFVLVFGCFVFDISIQKYYNNRCKHIGGVEMSYQKKSMKPYIEGLQDGSVCHRIMYQKKEKMLSRLMTL